MPSSPRHSPGRVFALTAAVATMLGGCANAALPSLTTGSLFGGSAANATTAPPAKPVIRNDPLARTLQVARVAARAQRCGFHVDTDRLKANFIAAEGREPGAEATALAKLDQTYTVTYNATLKVVTREEGYCSERRVAHVKGDLTRHLGGDFSPGSPFEAAEEPGLVNFGGGLFGGDKAEE